MAPNNQSNNLKDFGVIKPGMVVSHAFIIQNDSKGVLHIKDITTSCGCTVSEVKNKILEPGESTYLNVKFDSKGYFGPVEQFVYVQTDSLEESLIRFIIKANISK
jgi:GTPase